MAIISGRPTSGNDRIVSDGANDTIKGLGGNDTLVGNGGNDVLIGGVGNDSLSGGNGNDRLVGGRGKDSLTGNGQKDAFVFEHRLDSVAGANRDVIRDFYHGTDTTRQDIIDLSDLGPLEFIGKAQFSEPGEVRWFKPVSGPLIVQINLDGSGGAEMEIQLNGISGQGSSLNVPAASWFDLG